MLQPLVQDIAGVAYTLDSRCRSDLHSGAINDERQYVAALATRIRDYWRCRGLQTHLYAQALPSTQEKLLGCDAAIVLRVEAGVKVGLFEAKWPRFLSSGYAWDYRQVTTGLSHFSSQLSRQTRVASHVAVWELFMLEACPGQYHVGLDSWGATCLWHSEATLFDSTRANPQALWSQSEARALAQSVKRHGKHLGTCVRRLAECTAGLPAQVIDGQVPVTTWDGQTLSLPVDVASIHDAAPAAARALGLSVILYADLRESGVPPPV